MLTPAAIASSTSLRRIRHQAMTRTGKPARAMRRIASCSASPIAGVPASISSTPASASAPAMSNFSDAVNATPGVCSPSLSVVSLIATRLPKRRRRKSAPVSTPASALRGFALAGGAAVLAWGII